MTQNNNVEKFHFKGTADEVVAAKDAAKKLGFIPSPTNNGIPFVTSEEGITLKDYMIYNNIVGWWNYVTTSEYLAIMAS